MRQSKQRDWWETETAWIEQEAAKCANQRMGMFYTYCSMQAHFAKQDGFEDLANRILVAQVKE